MSLQSNTAINSKYLRFIRIFMTSRKLENDNANIEEKFFKFNSQEQLRAKEKYLK